MELSSEDALRLRVLLANGPLAIRIDESRMTLHGLLRDSEVTIRLNPTCGDEKYLKQVRALLSEHALGSPGGYPLYLQRWTRMGQMRDDSLQQLLLLGDPTAVFAVVCAEGLTDEIARCAWWAAEEAENARRMLQTEAVARGRTGPVLARFLVEYLPFETDPEVMVESVSAVLQPGLLEPAAQADLWRKAQRKIPYLLGFVQALPDRLPGDGVAHPLLADCDRQLAELVGTGNPCAATLRRLLSAEGQLFVASCAKIIDRPPTQDVITTAFDLLRDYLQPVRPDGDPDQTLEQLLHDAATFCARDETAAAVCAALPQLQPQLQAARLLSGVGYGVLRPLMRGSDAVGSLMRRKLKPVIAPLLEQLQTLGAAPPERRASRR